MLYLVLDIRHSLEMKVQSVFCCLCCYNGIYKTQFAYLFLALFFLPLFNCVDEELQAFFPYSWSCVF
jgi:hypothetical protein